VFLVLTRLIDRSDHFSYNFRVINHSPMAIFEKSQDRLPGNVETIIGPTVKVEGNFVGEGDVAVEGSVNGSLKTAKNLRVGSSAKIKADVDADNIFIAGEIRGNVRARGRLELAASGRIYGNVDATVLAVEAGAVLHGKCQMAAGREADASVSANNSTAGHSVDELERVAIKSKR